MIDCLAFYVVSAVFKLYNGGSASYAQCMLYVYTYGAVKLKVSNVHNQNFSSSISCRSVSLGGHEKLGWRSKSYSKN